MSAVAYKLRPSAAATWIVCHGSPGLSAGAPEWDEGEDIEVREEGTACHWAAHEVALGKSVAAGTLAPNLVPVDDEMFDAIDLYLGHVRKWGGLPPMFEVPISCARIHPECGGTPDVFAYEPARKILRIADLKYGFRLVHVVGNWQLICYAAGLLDYFKLSDLDTWIEFAIVQPRAYHRDGPVRTWTVHASELRGWINQLSYAAHSAFPLVGVPVSTVNSGCAHCPGRARCMALRQAALSALDATYDATPDDLPFEAAEDELRRLQWSRDIIDARITGLDAQVNHGIRRGAISRYFELQPKTGREVWKEGSEAQVKAIADLLGASITKPAKLITPNQARAILPAAIVAQHSFRPSGGMKLAPSDPEKWRRLFGKKPDVI